MWGSLLSCFSNPLELTEEGGAETAAALDELQKTCNTYATTGTNVVGDNDSGVVLKALQASGRDFFSPSKSDYKDIEAYAEAKLTLDTPETPAKIQEEQLKISAQSIAARITSGITSDGASPKELTPEYSEQKQKKHGQKPIGVATGKLLEQLKNPKFEKTH